MKSRRSFIKSVSVATVGLTLAQTQKLVAGNSTNSPKGNAERNVHLFSKHLQWLGYTEMAATARKIGFYGIDLTVRPKGHVLPERVAEDLPRAVKAIRGEGLIIDRITTAITDPDDPFTIPILETAAGLGIKNYRTGWLDYDPSVTIKENLVRINQGLVKLAALNKKLGLKGAYQNHAGENVGGAVWDLEIMLDGIDPEYLGIRYDIRHATASGGPSWPVGLKYVADKINSLDLKDFVWEKVDGAWQPVTVPLGKGMVDFERYFKLINELNIPGDFTLHFEYSLGGADKGANKLSVSPQVVTTAMKQDLSTLRNWLKQ